MAACLSGASKRKKKKKSGNDNDSKINLQRNSSHISASFPTIKGIKHKNGRRKQINNNANKHLIPSSSKHNANEEYEWIQQQKILISRIQLKPNQYLILSQKDIHDTIDKILSKYPNTSINWHWFNGRFEPVLNDNNHTLLTQKSIATHSRNNTMDLNQYQISSMHGHNHHGHNHEFHDHSSVHTVNTTMTGTTANTKHKKHLLRMNGQHCVKCKSCFRKNMKREYLTQKDILFLIKYSLKFFIQYRGEYKHQCSWKQKLDHLQGMIL